jgi:hypothetical protein
METITVEVWLYGPLAQYGGDKSNRIAANLYVELPVLSTMRNLLGSLGLPTEERGITFINGDLCAMPGLQPDLDHCLQDHDRVAFFHLKSMWPFQYRHGAGQTPELAQALVEQALFHDHSDH